MHENKKNYERERAEIEKLELAIFAARNFVVASQDLRPRTLEAAKEYCSQQRRLRRIGISALAASLVWFTCAPAISTLSGYQSRFSGPSRSEMERTALELSKQKGYGPNWGLVEAFLKLRTISQGR